MAIDIQDDTFGRLTQYQNCDWEFEFSSKYFGNDLTIIIEGGEAEMGDLPEREVYESFKWFRDNQLEIKNVVEKRIFKEYQCSYQEFRQAWGNEADDHVPNITLESDIWGLVKQPSISFYCDYCDFGNHWRTSWDPEHGINIFFKNGEIINVE